MAQDIVARNLNGGSSRPSHAPSSGSQQRHRERPGGTDASASSSRGKGHGQMTLTSASLQSFHVSKAYAEPLFKPQHTVTSLAFDDRGEHLVTAGDDETIHIFSCTKGKHQKTLYSKKYGVHLARFTHRNDSIIYASTKEDDTIRHHSLSDNKYLQYFRGHHAKVTSLQMSPVNDSFLSGAQDESLRLWDLRSPTCQGQFPLQGRPVIAWDPAGDVFALGISEAATVLLYDVRSLSPQPLLTIPLANALAPGALPPFVTSLAFHPGSRLLLIGTASDVLYVAEAYTGRVLFYLEGHACFKGPDLSSPDLAACGQEVGWTPDGQFVFAGSQSGTIHFWQLPDKRDAQSSPLTLSPTLELPAFAAVQARAVAFNPRFAMMASASSHVALWLPPLEEEEDEK